MGSDDNGKKILSLTKNSRTEQQHKGEPLPDAYIDTRLPYLRVTKVIYPEYVKSVERNSTGYYEGRYKVFGLPSEVVSLRRQGYVVNDVLVQVNAHYTHRTNIVMGIRGTTDYNSGKHFTKSEYNQNASYFNFMPAKMTAKQLCAQRHALYNFVNASMLVYQVTNMKIDPHTGALTFEDVPTEDGIKLTNSNFTVGRFNYKEPSVLTIHETKDMQSYDCYWSSTGTKNTFQSTFGNNNIRDLLLARCRKIDYNILIDIAEHVPQIFQVPEFDKGRGFKTSEELWRGSAR